MKFFVGFLFVYSWFSSLAQTSVTWEEALHTKKGNLIVYWYTSKPFIFENEKGQLAGVEYDLMENFKRYLHDVHQIDLTLTWKKSDSFFSVIQDVKNSKVPVFGASAFSITDERLKWIKFSPTYLGDISVLISSKDVPLAKTEEELFSIINNLQAVTIKGTTYENDLMQLKEKNHLNFSFNYIPSSDNVLNTVETQKKSFGYIDLPVYLAHFTNNTNLDIRRQGFLTVKRSGYGLIFSKESDWEIPLGQYFSNPQFQNAIVPILGKYMDPDIYEFLNRVTNATEEDIELLSKEKETQSNELRFKALQIERDATLRKILMATLAIIGISLVVIGRFYYLKHRTNQLLAAQKGLIEAQRKNIELQKIELEKRNQALEEINQEKNHLIKVLAHDLRSPLNQITGLVKLMEIEKEKNQSDYIHKIQHTSKRLAEMISKILDVDAIENNRINLSLQEIEVLPLLQEILRAYEKTAAEKNISIQINIPAQNLKVVADQTYLAEVIENLVSNALKFSYPHKTIQISGYEKQNQVEIRITDEGPGFTEEDKKQLFQKFTKLSAQPTAGEQSTVLGLSIVKKFMSLMNGEVSCESEHGKGSTFILTFQKSAAKLSSEQVS
ncbi:MAG TPA: hypothetical protein DGG95_08895 [Cytophagales bacterium]|nr:hypothetical protein [Cytophagales bacterium]